ncbi:MAG TPA: glycosyltransferase family 4 protein, partial [bacterium]|nr:glycosyltransferase family 4 protein [bacterium]
MRHLILSREFPPAAYPAGGIGTYVLNIARLLAKAGDVVHVIGQQWTGATLAREVFLDGRLIVHRVPIDTPVEYAGGRSTQAEIDLLRGSANPAHAWNWNATILAEALVEREGIDAVEAQEWEAPLYFFLLRRALGLGPSRLPPCIVQLHSPSEFIWLHNEWSYGRPEFLPLRRQEQYCIAAADALLCPSRYLARQSEAHFGLAPGSVHLIPYPVGDFPAARREDRSYETGPVLYAGRLEPRKGLIEFIEAAIAVARDTPDVVFEFAGADVMYRDGTVGQYLRSRIPESLRPRFVFQGALSRPDLAARFGRARLAVVPSRWENFPNTCIEAMHAGLPVLVSPDGGMAEMVQDGRTGWVAASQRPADLEASLRRALETPSEQRAAMGRAASASIRQRCNDGRVTEAHQRWRRKVAAAGVGASLRLPAILPWAGARIHGEDRLTVRRPTPQDTVRIRSGAVASASTAGTIATALSAMPEARVVLVARDGYVPTPDFADRACEIMATLPEVGIVSGWS